MHLTHSRTRRYTQLVRGRIHGTVLLPTVVEIVLLSLELYRHATNKCVRDVYLCVRVCDCVHICYYCESSTTLVLLCYYY